MADAKKLESVQGIKPGEVMPIAVVSPGLPANFLGLAGLMVMPDRTMFIGVDPNRAFKLMELDFREGNAAEAQRLLNLGHHVLVTTEFKQLKGLGKGDKLPLKTDHGWENYTIAGVVWSPGIDVIVSIFDLGRQMDQRTSASVFGSLADAERDFGVKKFLLFAANLEYFTDKQSVVNDVQHALRAQGMRAGDVRHIKYRIERAFYNILLLVSTVAFAAMGVAALGVTNTVMASVRTRRWPFGILRSIGMTRLQLLRLVLAEAALLGVVACAIGTVAGLDMSMNAEAMVVVVTGYKPPVVIPWNYVLIGGGIIVAVALLASLWPAVWVARAQPLELLQAGRAAT
jgi:putative ABC transport system permease protein